MLTKFLVKIFDKLVNLQLLQLKSNNLNFLPTNLFSNLRNLQTLILFDNNLSYFNPYLEI